MLWSFAVHDKEFAFYFMGRHWGILYRGVTWQHLHFEASHGFWVENILYVWWQQGLRMRIGAERPVGEFQKF